MFVKVFDWLKANPVYVLDAIKAIVGLLGALGVPVTSGVSAAVAAVVIALLAIPTQKAVAAHVDEAAKAAEGDAAGVTVDDGTPLGD